MNQQAEYTVRNNPAAGQYELMVGDAVAGFAAYRDSGQVREFPHTVIDPNFRGQGLSSPLIQYALDDTREAGKKVRPSCWAVAGFIDKNPEYKDLLA